MDELMSYSHKMYAKYGDTYLLPNLAYNLAKYIFLDVTNFNCFEYLWTTHYTICSLPFIAQYLLKCRIYAKNSKNDQNWP